MPRVYPDTSRLPEAQAAKVRAFWDRGYALEGKAHAAYLGRGPALTDAERREYATFRMTAETELAGFVLVYVPPDD